MAKEPISYDIDTLSAVRERIVAYLEDLEKQRDVFVRYYEKTAKTNIKGELSGAIECATYLLGFIDDCLRKNNEPEFASFDSAGQREVTIPIDIFIPPSETRTKAEAEAKLTLHVNDFGLPRIEIYELIDGCKCNTTLILKPKPYFLLNLAAFIQDAYGAEQEGRICKNLFDLCKAYADGFKFVLRVPHGELAVVYKAPIKGLQMDPLASKIVMHRTLRLNTLPKKYMQTVAKCLLEHNEDDKNDNDQERGKQ